MYMVTGNDDVPFCTETPRTGEILWRRWVVDRPEEGRAHAAAGSAAGLAMGEGMVVLSVSSTPMSWRSTSRTGREVWKDGPLEELATAGYSNH